MNANKSGKKPQRSIGIVAWAGLWFLLEITVGKTVSCYLAREIHADFGRAFQLEKQDDQGTAETYHVNLHGIDGHHSCECRGFVNHGHCKHVEGLLALQKAGKLTHRPEGTAEDEVISIAGPAAA